MIYFILICCDLLLVSFISCFLLFAFFKTKSKFIELENVKLCCDAGNQTVSRGEFQHLFAKSGMKESEFVSRFTPEIGNKLKKLLLEEMVTLDEILIGIQTQNTRNEK